MDILLDNRLLNLTLNSFLFDAYSKDKLISQSDLNFNFNFNNTNQTSLELWIISIIAAILVGMAGMVPLIFIPFTLKCISSEKNGKNIFLNFFY